MTPEIQQMIYNYFPYLQYLPKKEREIIDFLKKGLKESQIAEIFNITQGAVSSRIIKVHKRLKFIRIWRNFEMDENDLNIFSELDKEIIITMARTTCQTETAEQINCKFSLEGDNKMTQVKVRHRFYKCLYRLELLSKKEEKYRRYVDFLNFLSKNMYRMHEVRLPHFDRG